MHKNTTMQNQWKTPKSNTIEIFSGYDPAFPQIQYSSISLARRRTWPSISTAREWRRYWEGQCSTV